LLEVQTVFGMNIDGRGVRIRSPPNSCRQYFNCIQYHTVLLQAVVNANIKFISVYVGGYGRQSKGMFSSTQLYITP
jgi:hypothetical protein